MFCVVSSGWPLESIRFRKSSHTKNQCNWRIDHSTNLKEHKNQSKTTRDQKYSQQEHHTRQSGTEGRGRGFNYTREGAETIRHRWERLGWQVEVVEEDKDQLIPTELLINEILNMSGWDTWKHTSSSNLQQKWWAQAVILLCLNLTQQKNKCSLSC